MERSDGTNAHNDGLRCCIECGEPLNGRSDKKFCGDYCRNLYNNRLNRMKRRSMNLTNRRLAHNYKLLEGISERSVRLSSLERDGFAKNLFTGCAWLGVLRYYECYDMRYRILFGHLILLRRGGTDRRDFSLFSEGGTVTGISKTVKSIYKYIKKNNKLFNMTYGI